MTAHRVKPTITSERIAWFVAYLEREPAWGVFHVSLDDDNYDLGAARDGRESWPADVQEAATWFDQLTESQRHRLAWHVDVTRALRK